jgi:hypothetical protein
VIIPHPFRPLQRFKYPLDKLAGKIYAIETLNSRTPDSSNNAAANIAQRLPLAAVGSSDAHILMDIGKAHTEFDGELRDAIKERRTKSGVQKTPPWPSFRISQQSGPRGRGGSRHKGVDHSLPDSDTLSCSNPIIRDDPQSFRDDLDPNRSPADNLAVDLSHYLALGTDVRLLYLMILPPEISVQLSL